MFTIKDINARYCFQKYPEVIEITIDEYLELLQEDYFKMYAETLDILSKVEQLQRFFKYNSLPPFDIKWNYVTLTDKDQIINMLRKANIKYTEPTDRSICLSTEAKNVFHVSGWEFDSKGNLLNVENWEF